MSNDLMVRQLPEGNLEMTATRPEQMPHMQQGLIDWSARKLVAVEKELDDALEAEQAALIGGFKTTALHRITLKHRNRLTYYQKLKAALEAGYVLIPTMPMETFAIRTKAEQTGYQLVRYHKESIQNENPTPNLPVGEGEYRCPRPETEATTLIDEIKNSVGGVEQRELKGWKTTGDFEELEFPLEMARPEIIEVTTQAMHLKIFDAIGIAPPNWQRQGDPVLVGTIIQPNKKVLTFLLAWTVPTIDL